MASWMATLLTEEPTRFSTCAEGTDKEGLESAKVIKWTRAKLGQFCGRLARRDEGPRNV